MPADAFLKHQAALDRLGFTCHPPRNECLGGLGLSASALTAPQLSSAPIARERRELQALWAYAELGSPVLMRCHAIEVVPAWEAVWQSLRVDTSLRTSEHFALFLAC